MFEISEISPLTIQAYREADYCVYCDAPFVLKIGVVCDSLDKVYRQYLVDSAAFVTACNPFGKVIDAAANEKRQAELKQALLCRGVDYVEGAGRDPSGKWLAEPSCFVPGLSLDDARTLGSKFDQNAVVWCGSDAIPQLILLK